MYHYLSDDTSVLYHIVAENKSQIESELEAIKAWKEDVMGRSDANKP
ncbi:hypothetical protein Vi05172_g12893 [Venturia inaequalis]|nr:hypothetical protein Vi05172_g12893 [Venturia inaequalis]